MAGAKGIAALKHLRGRSKAQRGGKAAGAVIFDRSEPGNMADYSDTYLEWLGVRNYSDETINGRRRTLDLFLAWAYERELIRAEDVTKAILESYMRHLYRYRKPNGKPLGYGTQRERIGGVRDFFRWLCRSDHIPFNPASELEMPRPEKRLPEEPLSIAQVETVLGLPDLDDPLGVRDRAMMELFYSCGLRRSELVKDEGEHVVKPLLVVTGEEASFQHFLELDGRDLELVILGRREVDGKVAAHLLEDVLDEHLQLCLVN